MNNVYSVAQVNSYIKNMFTQDFLLRSIFVKGEASNVKYHSTGHIYFTLKDQKGTIACVMFAGNRNGLAFRLEDGQQIIVGGTVDIYERDGKYQLYAKEILLEGGGLLYQKFEQLKQELAEMGMFSAEYKQKIPKYIKKLGVVTAGTGAAVRDIINIATRRNPYIQIILYPAIVQGDKAAESIVNGIRALEMQQVDVMIVGRGGGSIEDLWAFNEEIVARAIFECSVPVITGIGHETDTTIADFVADLRASTPSAAAELAVFEYVTFVMGLNDIKGILNIRQQQKIRQYRVSLEQFKLRLMHKSPNYRISEQRQFSDAQMMRIQELMTRKILKNRHQLDLYIEKLHGLSPLDKLKQGYSYVSDMEGHCIRSVEGMQPSNHLQIHVVDGTIEATIDKITRIERDMHE